MGPDLPARDRPLVEQLHQVRPRDVQQVGRLLGRQLRADRRQGHRVPPPHLRQGPHEQPQGRGGQGQLLARRAGPHPQPDPSGFRQVGRQPLARLPGEGRIRLGRRHHLIAVCQLGHLPASFTSSDRPPFSLAQAAHKRNKRKRSHHNMLIPSHRPDLVCRCHVPLRDSPLPHPAGAALVLAGLVSELATGFEVTDDHRAVVASGVAGSGGGGGRTVRGAALDRPRGPARPPGERGRRIASSPGVGHRRDQAA